MQLDELKTEVSQILDRYEIPMDDKSFIIDKIEGQISTIAEEVMKAVQSEREKDGMRLQQMREKATGLVNGTLEKARNSVKQAYTLGKTEAMADAIKSQGPNWWMIGLTGGVLLLASYASFTLVRDFWFKGKKDD